MVLGAEKPASHRSIGVTLRTRLRWVINVSRYVALFSYFLFFVSSVEDYRLRDSSSANNLWCARHQISTTVCIVLDMLGLKPRYVPLLRRASQPMSSRTETGASPMATISQEKVKFGE